MLIFNERKYCQNKEFCICYKNCKVVSILCNDKKEFVLSKQLLRSGTSIEQW